MAVLPNFATLGAGPTVLMLHDASLGDMLKALEAIRALSCVRWPPSWMRVETLQG